MSQGNNLQGRDRGLTGRVFCYRVDNPLGENKHIDGILKIDPENVPEWNFYNTHITSLDVFYNRRMNSFYYCGFHDGITISVSPSGAITLCPELNED